MADMDEAETAAVWAVLEGGPADVPAALRIYEHPVDGDIIKVQWLGGYEHFHRVEGDERPHRFRWAQRTKIAE